MEPTIWLYPILAFLVTLFFIQKVFIKPVKLRLPPGPRKLPIIGNLHQLAAKNTSFHLRLRELARVHGPIMHLHLGEVSTVVISSADVAKEIMKTQDINFANRPKLMVGRILYHDYSDIGLAPYGEYWRQIRKIATLELFTVKRVQSFRYIREEEVTKFIKYLALPGSSGSVVDLSHNLFSLMFNITSRIVFGQKGEEQEAFKVFLTNLVDVLDGFSLADLYPSIKLLDTISGLRRQLKKMIKNSDQMLRPIIDNHLSNKKEPGSAHEDLVDVLLKFHSDNLPFSLTINNIKSVIPEIFSAGNETSFATVEWAMSELLRNPNLMLKAQAEVRELYKEKGMIEEANLNELKFLKMVVKETLRLHPVLPLLVPRESIEHCQILGFDIPPKTRILVNAWAISTDPEYWEDPDVFNPERFEGSTVDFKGTNFEFIPFGAGRRMCPGIALGIATIELVLAMLLCHFDWKLPVNVKASDMNMDEAVTITVRRKNALQVIPIPYHV